MNQLIIEKPKAPQAWGFNGNSGQNRWLGTNDSTDFKIKTDNVERVTVKANGNVGIGTAEPGARLEVDGTVRFSGLSLEDNPGQLLGVNSLGDLIVVEEWQKQCTKVDIDGNPVSIEPMWQTGPGKIWTECGDVGVGTWPAVKFHVDGGGTSEASALFENGGQHFSIIPKLAGYAFNPLVQENDVGIIWSDGGYGGQNGSSGLFIGPHTSGQEVGMRIDANGNVSIGTHDSQGYKFAVKGNMIAEDIWVKLYDDWPDYVFESEYDLMSLTEVRAFIHTNKHLPGVPTAAEVRRQGNNLGEMDATLLKKIEEMTLYILELEERINELESDK